MPFILESSGSHTDNIIKTEIPNAADCLKEQFKNQDAVDFIIKIELLDASRMLSESERKTQLEATRYDFIEELLKMARHCDTNENDFIKLFHEKLGIKNNTSVMVEYEYCLAKYAADNEALEMGDVEINPHKIDPDSVDCKHIIDVDRRENEMRLTNKITTTDSLQRSSSCIMKAYRSNKVYDMSVASKVLSKLDFFRETKTIETNKIMEKSSEFAMLISNCLAQHGDK